MRRKLATVAEHEAERLVPIELQQADPFVFRAGCPARDGVPEQQVLGRVERVQVGLRRLLLVLEMMRDWPA